MTSLVIAVGPAAFYPARAARPPRPPARCARHRRRGAGASRGPRGALADQRHTWIDRPRDAWIGPPHPAGLTGVRQIFVSPTNGGGNALCAVTDDGKAQCIGNYNDWGQLGVPPGPLSTFTVWGGLLDVYRLAIPGWDAFCAMTTSGVVWCAGYGFGTPPVVQSGGSSHATMWLDTFAQLHLDDPDVLRAANIRTDCRVTTQGLQCVAPGFDGIVLGGPGEVVDAMYAHGGPQVGSRVCWLDVKGKVWCATVPEPMLPGSQPVISQHFAGTAVLALAGDRNANAMCVVAADGSIWCIGKNSQGHLGTGDMLDVLVETEVQPPGSVDLTCE